MAQQLAIETSGLTKRFGDQKAVNSISLEVPSGSVFGFLGPNGSGKTTTIRMLLGLAEATEGEIKLLGTEIPKDLEKALPRVGALVEGPAFYPFMSGRNNLLRIDAADRFSDSSTRIERVESALDRVGLHNAGNKKVHAYSLGMKQRLGLANALLKPRDILVLDEPTNGLDPQGTREVRNLIRSLSAEGITIFLSSHLLSEIEMLCSHVAVMSAGKIVAQGLIEDLRNEEPTRLYTSFVYQLPNQFRRRLTAEYQFQLILYRVCSVCEKFEQWPCYTPSDHFKYLSNRPDCTQSP